MIVQLHILECDRDKALRPSGARGMETLTTLDAVGMIGRQTFLGAFLY